MEPRLVLELVPQSSWRKNVRNLVPSRTWDLLRFYCYERAGHKCEICGGVGDRHPVECHEIWHYDEEKHEQTLVGLQALCPDCHSCKHIGMANRLGKLDHCIKHLMNVNEMSRCQAERMIQDAFALWRERSAFQWVVNMDLLPDLVSTALSSQSPKGKSRKTKPSGPNSR